MKFISIFILLFALWAQADTKGRLSNVIDTLSSTPASLSGYVSVGNDVILGQSQVPLGIIRPTASLKWRKDESIGFRITENELELNTDGAVVIKMSGIIFRIKSIKYDSSGHFKIDIKSPILEKTLEQRLTAIVEERYKEKMDQAFREISLIKNQRNGNDAKEIINRIVGIFRNSEGATMFDNVPMYGNIYLNFNFNQDKTLSVTDKYVAEVKHGDVISAGGRFNRTGNRFNISEVTFQSHRGVTFHPVNGSDLSMNSLRVMQVTISDRGVEPVMVTGAEETLSGVNQLVSLISNAQGAASLGREPNCDPRIPEVQAYLQRQLNGQLVPLIRQHRTALIRAGLDPRVLDALGG